jgi:hypothetical protein
MLLALTAVFSDAQFLTKSLDHQETPNRRCLLPGCENMTTHNGGYCCSDHCKIHRAEEAI